MLEHATRTNLLRLALRSPSII